MDHFRAQLDLHLYLEESCVYPALENYGSLKSQAFGFWKEYDRIREELQALLSVHQARLILRGACPRGRESRVSGGAA